MNSGNAKNKKDGNHKKMSETDKIFKETIEHWERLANNAYQEVLETVSALDMAIEFSLSADASKPEIVDAIRCQIALIQRALKETSKKIELLHGSLSGASILKPIDELEAKIIGAIRELDRVDGVGFIGRHRSHNTYKAIVPLLELANKKAGFTLPEWIKEYMRLEELKEAREVVT